MWKTQVNDYNRTIEILTKVWHAYLDTTTMGGGKTVITTAVAKKLNLQLLVVCPVTVMPGWEKMRDRYDAEILDIIPYDTLKGKDKNKVSHPWLDKAGGIFAVSKKFVEAANKGLLLVFDEVQEIKNKKTQRLDASLTLVRDIILHRPKSRISLLSATSFDKLENAEQIVKLLGIVTKESLYDYDRSTKKYNMEGLNQLVKWCMERDPVGTKEVITGKAFNRRTAPEITRDLLGSVVKKFVITAAEAPDLPFKSDSSSYYMYSDNESLENLKKAEKMMKSAVTLRESNSSDEDESGGGIGGRNRGESGAGGRTGGRAGGRGGGDEYQLKGGGFAIFTRGMILSAKSKIAGLYRNVRKVLEEDPQAKVIIYTRFKYTINWLAKALEDFDPLILVGSVSKKKREEIRNKFQEPNDEYRLLISNPKVGGMGIDLDDQDGNWPRWVFAIPDFFFLQLVQSTGRVLRGTTKSQPHIRFVYAVDFPEETKILDSLKKKTGNVKLLLNEAQISQQLFPGDFPKEIEKPKPTPGELADRPPIDFRMKKEDEEDVQEMSDEED